MIGKGARSWALAALLSILGCGAPSGELTEAQLRGFRAGIEVIEETPDDLRHIAAVSTLALCEEGRLPEKFRKDLRQYADEPGDQLSTFVALMLDGNNEIPNAACGDFQAVATEMNKVPLDDRAAFLFERCRFARYGMFKDAAEYATAPEIAFVEMNRVLAHFIVAYLKEKYGPLHPLEKRVLREMATAPSEPT